MDSDLKDIKDKAFEATKAKGRSNKKWQFEKIIEDTIGWA
jgi:hypothetical protein